MTQFILKQIVTRFFCPFCFFASLSKEDVSSWFINVSTDNQSLAADSSDFFFKISLASTPFHHRREYTTPHLIYYDKTHTHTHARTHTHKLNPLSCCCAISWSLSLSLVYRLLLLLLLLLFGRFEQIMSCRRQLGWSGWSDRKQNQLVHTRTIWEKSFNRRVVTLSLDFDTVYKSGLMVCVVSFCSVAKCRSASSFLIHWIGRCRVDVSNWPFRNEENLLSSSVD